MLPQCGIGKKAEAVVLTAQRWILAVLRHRRFYQLDDLNRAIAERLAKLGDRVMQHVKQSRRQLYQRLDRPPLKALKGYRTALGIWCLLNAQASIARPADARDARCSLEKGNEIEVPNLGTTRGRASDRSFGIFCKRGGVFC